MLNKISLASIMLLLVTPSIASASTISSNQLNKGSVHGSLNYTSENLFKDPNFKEGHNFWNLSRGEWTNKFDYTEFTAEDINNNKQPEYVIGASQGVYLNKDKHYKIQLVYKVTSMDDSIPDPVIALGLVNGSSGIISDNKAAEETNIVNGEIRTLSYEFTGEQSISGMNVGFWTGLSIKNMNVYKLTLTQLD